MTINTSSPILGGAGYNRTPAVSIRDNYTSTENNRAVSPVPTSDAALTEFSENGDILEVSSHSLLQFETFSSNESIHDYDLIRRLLAEGPMPGLVNSLNNMLNNIEGQRRGIREAEELIRSLEAERADAIAETNSLLQGLEDMESRIQAQEDFMDAIGEHIGILEDAVSLEEDRLENEAFALEERLDRQIERLDDVIDRRIERFERRLERRLARMERRQARFEARMERRQQNELNRQARADARIAGLEPGSPQYIAAREAEAARRERFGERVERWNTQHDNRVERANTRHANWYARETGRIQDRESNRDRQIEINEERVETMRTTSPRLNDLNRQIENMETMQNDTEEIINALQQEFEAMEANLEPELERLEELANARTALIEAANEQITSTTTAMRTAQLNLNNTIDNWIRTGTIVMP